MSRDIEHVKSYAVPCENDIRSEKNKSPKAKSAYLAGEGLFHGECGDAEPSFKAAIVLDNRGGFIGTRVAIIIDQKQENTLVVLPLVCQPHGVRRTLLGSHNILLRST